MKHTINEQVLNQLIVDYEPMIMSIIKRLNILYDTEDYMQIGRSAVHQAVTSYNTDISNGGSMSQYVYTRIYQRIIDEIRKTSRYTSNVDVQDNLDDGIGYLYSSLDYYAELLIRDVKKVLNTREFMWFELMLDGYSVAEISLIMNVSMSTVKSIRKSARNKIKTHL